jgi:hypothetical protein
MIGVLRDSEAIGKDRKNEKQGYKFRGIDDVYNDLHSIFGKHGIFTTSKILAERSETKATNSGGTSIYRILTIEYTFWCEDGSHIETTVIGEGMDSGDKASNKAMSVAHKYALLQAFSIPTEESKDPEHDDHDLISDEKAECIEIENRYQKIGIEAVNSYLVDLKVIAKGKTFHGCKIETLRKINSAAFEKELSKWVDQTLQNESK